MDLQTLFALLAVLLVLVSALLMLVLDNMIGAVAASGVVSLGVAVLFVLLHAPDVAMTEAVVGAGLSGVVLALGLRRLGRWRRRTGWTTRLRYRCRGSPAAPR